MPREVEGLQLRPGNDDDISQVIELMRSALGEGQIPRTREFWLWKHRESPFGPSPLWVAEQAGRLVGVRLFLRWQWQHTRGRANAVRAVDTATHPDFQGAGIFKRLTLGLVAEMTAQGVNFVFNTPNAQSGAGYLKMGWQTVGRVPLWLLPRRPLRMLRARLSEAAPSTPHTRAGPSDDSLGAVLAALPAGWSSGPPTSRYTTSLDGTYLRWRYEACPAVRYQAAATEPAKAFVIYRERLRGKLRELTLCETFSERSLAGARALRAALKLALARTQSDYALAAFRPNAWEAASMSSCGFVPAPGAGPNLTVRKLAGYDGMPDPTRTLSWEASIGDLELF